MSLNAPDAAELLDELRELPFPQRAARIQATGRTDDVLIALADEAERLAVSEVSRALEAAELVVRLADLLGRPPERARARRAYSQSLAYAGRFPEALAASKEAIELAEASGATLEAARARMSSIHALTMLTRHEEAVAAGEAARETFLEHGEIELAARVDSNLGAAHLAAELPELALRYFNRARPLIAGNRVAAAQVDSNRGHAFLLLDDFESAERAYCAALPAFEEAELSWAAAIVEGNLAELSTRQGRLQQALLHFERTRRHLERDNAPGELARVLVDQAQALVVLGLADEAVRQFEAAMPELNRTGQALEVVKARAGLGEALLRSRRLAEADAALAEAAGGYEALGHPTARARIDLMRAELAIAVGRLSDAPRLARQALLVLSGRSVDTVIAQLVCARAFLNVGDLASADESLQQAAFAMEQCQVPPLRADFLHTRAMLRARQRRGDEAISDLQEAVEQIERVRGTLQAERFRASFQGDRLRIFEDLVILALENARPDAPAVLFHAIERAKSRILLDLVQGSIDLATAKPTGAAGDAALAAELATRRTALSALYSRLADSRFSDTADTDWSRRRDELRELEQDVASLESRLATARGAMALFAQPIGLDPLQRALASDAALIEYYVANGVLLALVVRRDGVVPVRFRVKMDALHEMIGRVEFQIRRGLRPGATDGPRGARLTEDAQRELRVLYDALFAPLCAALQGVTRLKIIPHGVLHTVPFHALWDGAQHLIESFEFVYAPSASLMGARPPQHFPGTAGMLRAVVVGVADEFAPRIEEEARLVGAALPGATVLLGPEATVERFCDEAVRADVLHVACHGHFSADSPMSAGIRLADRWLTVGEIFDLRLRAELVTISGCETGRSRVGRGDELVGLIRAFLAAGAGSAIVSLWTVSDADTMELMRTMYDQLMRSGRTASISGALRAAQMAVLRNHPHPAFWAPFVQVGER